MRPIINYVDNFDALKEHEFEYTYLGTERVVTNELEIREDKPNSDPVYKRESTKFDKSHTLPPNILENGRTYKARIRVKPDEDGWSAWSAEVTFTCLRTPEYVFQNLHDEKYVYNNDIMMRVIFQQEQGDRVDTYQFVLMDSNRTTLSEYPTRVPQRHAPNVMEERIKGLIKGRLYYVGVRVRTRSNIEFFDYHEFIPHYIAPNTNSVVEVQEQPENGQILVQSYLRQNTGIQTTPRVADDDNPLPVNYTYLDDEWIVIPPHRPLMYDRLGVGKSSDFVLKVWLRNIKNGTFLKYITDHEKGIGMDVIKYDDYVVVEKQFMNTDTTGVVSRHRSNVVEGLGIKPFYLYIKFVEFRPEIYIELDD